jgi:hypothetical protein
MIAAIISEALYLGLMSLALWTAIGMSPPIKDPDGNRGQVVGANIGFHAIFEVLTSFVTPYFGVAESFVDIALFITKIALFFYTVHAWMKCPWWYSPILALGTIVIGALVTMGIAFVIAAMFGVAASM